MIIDIRIVSKMHHMTTRTPANHPVKSNLFC